MEIIFPTWLLLQCFSRFAEEQPQMRIELYETVLSGTEEALVQRKVDLAICSHVPPGFAGDLLMRIRFIAVAHPEHPLHQLGRQLTMQDLRKHRHLVIRDTGSQRRSSSWVGSEQIWTVSNKATSIHAAGMGLGFAWFPEETVRGELERGVLKPLPLREGGERWGDLYLVFADRDYAGPGALRLAQIIRKHVGEQCRRSSSTNRRRPLETQYQFLNRLGSSSSWSRDHFANCIRGALKIRAATYVSGIAPYARSDTCVAAHTAHPTAKLHQLRR